MYNREDLLVKIAIMHYQEGHTQTYISQKLGISRPTIATLLAEAIEKNIVQITINHPNKHLYDMQEIIKNRYNLDTLLIAPENGKNEVGRLAADFLESILPTIKTIGIGWGSTMSEVVNSMKFQQYPDHEVIPLIGGVGSSNNKIHSNHLAIELAKKLNAHVDQLYAPAIADTQETKELFCSNDLVYRVLEKGKKVDLALLSMGNPFSNSNYKNLGYLSENELKELESQQVVGDILTSFFDSSFQPVQTQISNRMIGLNLKDLENIKEVALVVSGREKYDALTATLNNSHIINHLIIDYELGTYLIENIKNTDEQIAREYPNHKM